MRYILAMCPFDEPMSTEMLKDICDGSQFNPNVNRREEHYKKRDIIKQRQWEQKGALKSMQNMGKYLHKVFKTFVKQIFQYYDLWLTLVQKFPILFQNTETFLKLPNFQMT